MSIDVSVILASVRFGAELAPALASVLCQQGLSIEALVIDAGPEGSADSAVSAVSDERVRYLPRDGLSGSNPALLRNRAAAIARGRYLQFLDDGDLLEPDALAVLRAALESSSNAGMAFGAAVPFGGDEPRLRQQQRHFRQAARVARRLKGRLQLVKYLLFRPAILINSACMVRRAAFADSGGYDAGLPVNEHVDLWQRIARATGFVYLDRPVVRYSAGSATRMDDLRTNDPCQKLARRATQRKYRQTHGVGEFILLKIWACLVR